MTESVDGNDFYNKYKLSNAKPNPELKYPKTKSKPVV